MSKQICKDEIQYGKYLIHITRRYTNLTTILAIGYFINLW